MRPALAFAAASLVMPAAAQEAIEIGTAIVPDSLPSLSTGTRATTEGAVTEISGGLRQGGNLFHSFERFTLGPGDIARWTAADPLAVRNVINRVTGGAQSYIGGTIDASAMPEADFYFLNPAGILIGEGAVVDVGGVAHFTTAGALRFDNGDVLVAGTASGSTFSMADPARFGFLGDSQPILVSGNFFPAEGEAPLFSFLGGRVSLSAGDIFISNSRIGLEALALRAVGTGVAELPVDTDAAGGGRGGRIALFDSTILTATGGRVTLAAGDVLIAGRSEIGVTAGEAALPAIDIRADRFELEDGELRVSGVPGLAARGGDLSIVADEIIVREFAAIRTESMLEGGGGTILLDAGLLLIEGGTVTASGVSAPGRSVGDIVVRADRLRIVDFGALSSTLFQPLFENGVAPPVGTTGRILIDAGRIEIDGTGLILAQSVADSASGPGSVTIRADEMAIGTGLISTGTGSATAAGAIDVTVAGLLDMTGFGGIQSVSQGLGDAGAITIRAGAIRMANLQGGPLITSATEIARPQEIDDINDFVGSAGRITITTGSLEMSGQGTEISTSSSSFGDAGDIVIRAARVAMRDQAEISSSALALNLLDETRTFFIRTPGPGRAGTVDLDAGAELSVTDSIISTATEGFGAAGAVTVRAERIALGAGAAIRSDASDLAPGAAGTVELGAADIALVDGASITTGSANASTAGNIVLTAREALAITGVGSQVASVNSAAGTGGAAGNIIVSAPRITLGPAATITTNALAGAAGQIDLRLPATGLLRLAGGDRPAAIATSSGPGTGGRISIARPYALIADGGRIEALGQRRGANVQLATDFFIRSADNSNLLLVDGDLVVDSQVGNVSSGIDTPDISFGDAAGVLAGQCRAARSSGAVSRLAMDLIGPLALGDAEAAAGGCH